MSDTHDEQVQELRNEINESINKCEQLVEGGEFVAQIYLSMAKNWKEELNTESVSEEKLEEISLGHQNINEQINNMLASSQENSADDVENDDEDEYEIMKRQYENHLKANQNKIIASETEVKAKNIQKSVNDDKLEQVKQAQIFEQANQAHDTVIKSDDDSLKTVKDELRKKISDSIEECRRLSDSNDDKKQYIGAINSIMLSELEIEVANASSQDDLDSINKTHSELNEKMLASLEPEETLDAEVSHASNQQDNDTDEEEDEDDKEYNRIKNEYKALKNTSLTEIETQQMLEQEQNEQVHEVYSKYMLKYAQIKGTRVAKQQDFDSMNQTREKVDAIYLPYKEKLDNAIPINAQEHQEILDRIQEQTKLLSVITNRFDREINAQQTKIKLAEYRQLYSTISRNPASEAYENDLNKSRNTVLQPAEIGDEENFDLRLKLLQDETEVLHGISVHMDALATVDKIKTNLSYVNAENKVLKDKYLELINNVEDRLHVLSNDSRSITQLTASLNQINEFIKKLNLNAIENLTNEAKQLLTSTNDMDTKNTMERYVGRLNTISELMKEPDAVLTDKAKHRLEILNKIIPLIVNENQMQMIEVLKNEVDNLLTSSNDEITKEVLSRYKVELNNLNIHDADATTRSDTTNRLEILTRATSLMTNELFADKIESLVNQANHLKSLAVDNTKYNAVIDNYLERIEEIKGINDQFHGKLVESDIRIQLEEGLNDIQAELHATDNEIKKSKKEPEKIETKDESPEAISKPEPETEPTVSANAPLVKETNRIKNTNSNANNDTKTKDKSEQTLTAIREVRKRAREALLQEMKNLPKEVSDHELLGLIDKRDKILEKSRSETKKSFLAEFQTHFEELASKKTHAFKKEIINNISTNQPNLAKILPPSTDKNNYKAWTPLQRFVILLDNTIKLYDQLNGSKSTTDIQMEKNFKAYQQEILSDHPPSNEVISTQLKKLREIHPTLVKRLRDINDAKKNENQSDMEKHQSPR